MTPKELKQKRESLNLNQEEFAKDIGKTRLTVSRWENADKLPESASKLLEMYFSDDTKGYKNEGEINIVNEAGLKNSSTHMMVPLVNHRAKAGFLSHWGDTEYIGDLPKIIWEVDQEYKGRYICFEVYGDSMDNQTPESLLENDILLTREVARHHWKDKLHIKKWDFVIVHKTEGVMVKRITEHDTTTGKLTLHSLNDYYEDQEVFMDDLIAIFNVVDLKRNRRRI